MVLPQVTRWLLGLAAWTLVGVFFASQTYIGSAYALRPLTWPQAFAVALTAWYARAALSPVVWWLARRFPIRRRQLAGRAALHLAAGAAWSAVAALLIERLSTALLAVPRRALSPVEIHTSLLTYAALLGLAHAEDYYRRYRDRELVAARLQAQLASARLDLLRLQLNPHFLFNTLHDISQLMHEDVERAELMVEHISELLRLSLRHMGEPEVSLREEVAFLRRYLALEQMRFQDRLETRIDVHPGAMDARVPYLILQPLVENAIRHGVGKRQTSGRVEVRAEPAGDVLRLQIRDDGPGLAPPAGRPPEGIGLRNTRARLRESYGDAHRLELESVAGGGLCATVELPLRFGSPETGPPVTAGAAVASGMPRAGGLP
jgi:two-component system, LytTR family, sensor kinase